MTWAFTAAASRVEKGVPVTAELQTALNQGTAIGGARPKSLIQNGSTKCIAKFSSSNDLYSIVKAEFIAMRLAALAGLDAAPVQLVRSSGKDVLLVERFDREPLGQTWGRKCVESALTLSDEAELTQADRNLLWHRAFLNPFSLEM